MIVLDIIYNNLINLLINLTSDRTDSVYDDFFETVDSSLQDSFIAISENITGVINNLRLNKTSAVFPANSQLLIHNVKQFESNFPDYPNARYDEIYLAVELIAKIKSEVDETTYNFTEDLNIDTFCLSELDKPFHHKNFHYYNGASLNTSIFLFSLIDSVELLNYIRNEPVSSDLCIYLLSKIGISSQILGPKQYVLIDNALQNNKNTIRSCVAIHIVKSGNTIHTPYLYTNPPNVHPSRKIIPGTKYQQFDDSITILSEYNDQKDIMDKYLRIYHVIENFMYKFPVVTLERNSSNVPFSIRDFQRMYDKLKSNELGTLRKFFIKVLNEVYTPPITFGGTIYHEWRSLVISGFIDKSKIDSLLSFLRIQNSSNDDITFDDVSLQIFPKFFTQLVYAFRNTMVHNRETEFHLTHETLINHSTIGDTALKILEKLLIPWLEEIIFYLLLENNSIVWYNDSKLNLWIDN